MNVLISINSDYKEYLSGKHNDYESGYQLIKCFQSKGHVVRLFYPEDASKGLPDKLYKIEKSSLFECEAAFDADLLLVRHLGENASYEVSKSFVEALP